MLKMFFKPLNENAKQPAKGTKRSAAWDLFSPIYFTLQPGEFIKVDLGFAMQVPYGFAAVAKCEKSGLAAKCIAIGGGLIDDDYQGEWAVMLTNNGPVPWVVHKGNKIAQFYLVEVPQDVEIITVDALNEVTERGTGGFGSTGV